ncbi:MAG: carboxy terminal-processing peptidase [Proteobacteria bacterium]|nr:carboxy terminal-processing peptidase [Pseudomonadota bacterium]
MNKQMQLNVSPHRQAAGRQDRGILSTRLTAILMLSLTALLTSLSNVAAATENSSPKAEDAPVIAEKAVWQALEPLDVHPRTSLAILEQLRHNHYIKKKLDDSTSSEIFEKYITLLDSGKVYFLASDMRDLEQYRYQLVDALKRGNLEPAFTIYNLHQTRMVDRLNYLIENLDTGLETLDFSIDEDIEIDRENAAWAATPEEQDDLWRKRIKAAALGMKLNGKDLPEIQTLLSKRYKNRLKQVNQLKSEDAFQLYVNAFASTFDPHTQYFSPRNSQNFNITMSLSLEGIGAVLRTDDEYTSVVRLVTAGPADKTGAIGPSDKVVSVGQGENGPLIDVVGWRLDDVVELIRGPKGSQVRLEIIPAGNEDGQTKTVQITRNTVQLEDQAAQKNLFSLNRNGQDFKVGVIEIPTFYADFKAQQQGDPNSKSTTRDVRRLIKELQAEGMDALVIDLRNNGGGSLQEADSLTGLFIESGPTVQVKAADRRPSVYEDEDGKAAWDGPLAVMVNRLSASASEIFAGAIQDYQRGLIIGSQTFGKGTVQTLIPLNRGQLKITAAKFYRVSGQSTQHQGVVPDIAFPEVYDVDRIGESSLDDALPWDMIQPAVFTPSDKVRPLLKELNDLHSARVVSDPEFEYLRSLALKGKEANQRTHISLNEQTRIAEKASDDKWRLDLENGLRAARGKALLASIKELDDEQEAEEAQDDGVPTPDQDSMLRETGSILLDYVSLTHQIAMVEHVPETAGLSKQP